jgi:hypothetical protein
MPNVGRKDKIGHKTFSSLGVNTFSNVFDTEVILQREILNICQYALLAVIPVMECWVQTDSADDPGSRPRRQLSIELVTEMSHPW